MDSKNLFPLDLAFTSYHQKSEKGLASPNLLKSANIFDDSVERKIFAKYFYIKGLDA